MALTSKRYCRLLKEDEMLPFPYPPFYHPDGAFLIRHVNHNDDGDGDDDDDCQRQRRRRKGWVHLELLRCHHDGSWVRGRSWWRTLVVPNAKRTTPKRNAASRDHRGRVFWWLFGRLGGLVWPSFVVVDTVIGLIPIVFMQRCTELQRDDDALRVKSNLMTDDFNVHDDSPYWS